jgi:hypothetical protein
MKMKLRCYDIDWETDGEVVEGLPTDTIIELFDLDDDYDPQNDDSGEAVNALSDAYGWLVNGFCVEVIKREASIS